MDRDSWAISKITVNCVLPESWGGKQIDYEVIGRWVVGDTENLSLPIAANPKCVGEIGLTVKAVIHGERPYAFEDVVSVHEKIKVAQQPQVEEQYLIKTA